MSVQTTAYKRSFTTSVLPANLVHSHHYVHDAITETERQFGRRVSVREAPSSFDAERARIPVVDERDPYLRSEQMHYRPGAHNDALLHSTLVGFERDGIHTVTLADTYPPAKIARATEASDEDDAVPPAPVPVPTPPTQEQLQQNLNKAADAMVRTLVGKVQTELDAVGSEIDINPDIEASSALLIARLLLRREPVADNTRSVALLAAIEARREYLTQSSSGAYKPTRLTLGQDDNEIPLGAAEPTETWEAELLKYVSVFNNQAQKAELVFEAYQNARAALKTAEDTERNLAFEKIEKEIALDKLLKQTDADEDVDDKQLRRELAEIVAKFNAAGVAVSEATAYLRARKIEYLDKLLQGVGDTAVRIEFLRDAVADSTLRERYALGAFDEMPLASYAGYTADIGYETRVGETLADIVELELQNCSELAAQSGFQIATAKAAAAVVNIKAQTSASARWALKRLAGGPVARAAKSQFFQLGLELEDYVNATVNKNKQ